MSEESVPICAKDGFPKVKIAGRWQCVAEYLNRCIGGQRIVDLVQREDKVYYVFESDHELPMLCFCCATPLVYTDLGKSRRKMVGRRLESMVVEPGELEDGQEMDQFRLELSKKGLLSRPVAVPVSIEAAAQMRHPPHCPRSRGSPASGVQRKRKRRKRKR